jgi:alpha-2-macroglobulin-like protein
MSHNPLRRWLPVLGLAALLPLFLTSFTFAADEDHLNPLGLQVVGSRAWLADSPAALRVVVIDHASGRPVAGAQVSLYLAAKGSSDSTRLLVADTDEYGTLKASFRVPAVTPGNYELTVRARWRALHDETVQSVQIRVSNQILLTTDKPLYKPGQTIHLRALALRRPDLRPLGKAALTFEVSDPKANKVFKFATMTDAFGIAATDFVLGDEINLGDYTVRALLGDDRVEKNVTVKRYVLPKFRVTLTPDKPFYLPGETVKGTVQVDYFFGKPVTGGKVQVVLKTFDVAFRDIAILTGQTDDHGAWKFEAALPKDFVGQPLEAGNAFLQLEAQVTDQAEHTERATVSSRVASAPLEIRAVPESGKLVPGVENKVFLLVTRPSGEPVQARVHWAFPKESPLKPTSPSPADIQTDALGVATLAVTVQSTGLLSPRPTPRFGPRPPGVQFTPPDPDLAATLLLDVSAKTTEGTAADKSVGLPVGKRSEAGSLLLRTDKVLGSVGDTLRATALTDGGRGTVYFDVVKDRQTMLTASAEILGGQASLSLPLTADLAGSIYLSAYRIAPDGQIIRAVRPLLVNPATDLNVSVHADHDTYRPGAENIARIAFAVTDARGKPIAAALGVNVVDESVFALQDMQPGMEKVYFYLEKELATPRYEIHGFEMPVMLQRPPADARPIPLAQDTLKQQAARVMLASVTVPALPTFNADTYGTRLAEARTRWLEKLRPLALKIQTAIGKWNQKHPGQSLKVDEIGIALVREGLLTQADLKDPWGTAIVLLAPTGQGRLYSAVLWSFGPDKTRGTDDDCYLPTGWPYQIFATDGEADQFGAPMMFARGAADGVPRPVMAPGMVGAGAPLVLEGVAKTGGGAGPGGAGAPPGSPAQPVRVRQFFPETLLVQPALLTGSDGKATLEVPMADSITSWRLTALANSQLGGLGSTTSSLRCFQDFFIDIDLPVALTQGDRVSIPVAVYNYLPQAQKVRLELTKADWFELTGPDQQELDIAPNEVDVRYFTITAKKLGSGKILVHGFGTHMSDAIERVAEVAPNGKLIESTVGGRLNGTVTQTVKLPADAIPDASNILVKIYPGIFSQVVEGLDSILRMPYGCFEQTSSTTYPNVLVLDYMKTIGRVTPEIGMKADGFINTGYQRLVSFEVKGGGFSWFGSAPANKILTAFGIMEFYDMAKVHEIDPALLSRTQSWLLSQQQADGSWKADEQYLHQESWGRIQNSQLPPTAYITWGLAYSRCQDPKLTKAVAWLREHAGETKDSYVLAMLANALVQADLQTGKDTFEASTNKVLDRLVATAKRDKGQMWWETEMRGVTLSSGASSDLEATGMAALALIAAGRNAEATEVLNYLVAHKDANGTWQSTQATVLALRALMASQKASTQQVDGEVTVLLNGQQADAFGLTPQNADVMRQVDGRKFLKPGNNEVTIRFEGKGSTLYQVVGKYYLPWAKVRPEGGDLLSIKVDYDRTTLNKDDMVTASVSVKNNTPGTTSMIIVDLGIPPGFEVQAEDLANLVETKVLQKYSLTGRQIICYLEKLDPQQVVKFNYRLRAKFPIHARTPKSTVYEYYNPQNRADSQPVDVAVK